MHYVLYNAFIVVILFIQNQLVNNQLLNFFIFFFIICFCFCFFFRPVTQSCRISHGIYWTTADKYIMLRTKIILVITYYTPCAIIYTVIETIFSISLKTYSLSVKYFKIINIIFFVGKFIKSESKTVLNSRCK